MKRIAFALIASAAALAASSAHADTRVRVGINIGAPEYTPAPVVVAAPPPAVVYAPAPVVVAPAPRGYWKDVQVRTWVPERWIVRTNRWGHSERYCEPGYYALRTERVWVDGRSERGRGYAYGHDHDRGHDGRYDNRGYAYDNNRGYGYDNRGSWNR
jgi:hypothetical protein